MSEVMKSFGQAHATPYPPLLHISTAHPLSPNVARLNRALKKTEKQNISRRNMYKRQMYPVVHAAQDTQIEN